MSLDGGTSETKVKLHEYVIILISYFLSWFYVYIFLYQSKWMKVNREECG